MAGTKYANVRELLAESHRNLPDRAIESVLARQGLQASAIEDFWSDLGNVVAAALPVVGGVVGSIVAPGVGTAIGSGLGSAAGSALHAAVSSGQPQGGAAQAPGAGVPQVFPPSAPGQPALPAISSIPGMQAPASSQQSAALLLELLMRPELLKAILAMLMGNAGTATVPVGSANVPITAMTNLLSNLSAQASEAYNSERAPSGGYGESTHYLGRNPLAARIDLASQEARSAALMNRLRESDGGAGRLRRRQRLATLAEALRMVHN
jgi:hypothetical protein